MKKNVSYTVIFMVSLLISACSEKKEAQVLETKPEPVAEVYQPKHESSIIDLAKAQKYDYRVAPMSAVATGVLVSYDKAPFTKPIVVKYSYANGDTYTYTIPQEFGLWKNEAGRLRVVIDNEHTVWLQGSTKGGKFHEFVFYGNPKYKGKKIKPNSYIQPKGEIAYRK